MEMKTFIRLDMKGQWRGKEHVSSVQGLGDEYVELFEEGISCYNLDDKAYALDNLREYWFDTASISESDLENMQVTIFEGRLIGQGSDWEDLAECERTIAEFEAKGFMMYIQNLWEQKEWEDELTEEEYEEKLNKIELPIEVK